jgi:hypothetical protein
MSGTGRVLFSCVAENGPSWFTKVHNLVLSIRSFGGSLAEAPVVVNFVDEVNPEYSDALEHLGASVRIVSPLDPEHRYANKLRMFELAEEFEFDVLAALDCDVIVVDDIAEFLPDGSLCGKPADCDFLSDEQWRRIFATLSLPVPEKSCVTTTFNQRTYPYLNSGVLLVPRDMCANLYSRWAGYVFDLEKVYATHPDIALRRKYNDQIALTCAVVAGDFPIQPLPVSMNFPTHIDVHPAFVRRLSTVRLIHYHRGLDEMGFIRGSKYPAVNRCLDRFNRRRAEVLNLPYRRLPRPSLDARIRQELASRRWYHKDGVERVKRGVKKILASVPVSDTQRGTRTP